jgi:hypothetical protein
LQGQEYGHRGKATKRVSLWFGSAFSEEAA